MMILLNTNFWSQPEILIQWVGGHECVSLTNPQVTLMLPGSGQHPEQHQSKGKSDIAMPRLKLYHQNSPALWSESTKSLSLRLLTCSADNNHVTP